jgi:ADP-heptose:LPS heptosyltransferase
MTAELGARRFSLVVNLYQVATWAGAARLAFLLSRIAGRTTAGRWSRGRGIIFNIRSADTLHEMDAMLALTAHLGCQPDGAGPRVWIPDASREAGVRCLQAAGITPSSPYVVLHVGSNKPEARLPEERAADIGTAVGRALNAPVLVVGDVSEVASAETVAARIGGGSRSVAGKTGLLELAAILEGARAAVVTDSGPMHLAAAVGTPLVALFGSGDPRRYGPRGRVERIAVVQGRQYPHDPARWHTDIRTDDVLDALRTRLNIAPFTAPD